MATGTGKTLTAAAVIKLFLRTGNAQRVLFLVECWLCLALKIDYSKFRSRHTGRPNKQHFIKSPASAMAEKQPFIWRP
jgi:hypothetical protein